MFGIQGGYLGNAAGMIRDISVPGELTGINPMTESYPQNMGNTTGPLAAGLGAMPPRMVASNTGFEIPGGAAVGRPLLPNMPELKQKGKRDPSLPQEEDTPFSLPQAMVPGAAGNISGMQMAQGMPIVPVMGVQQNPFGVYDHPGLRGMPSRSIYDGGNDLPQMFPMQPGGLGIPQGMPGYEFDRKIPPANVVRGIPAGFDRKFVS